MSIINKMLQDLDKRNGRPGGETVAGDAVRSIKPQSPWHLGRNARLLMLGIVAAGLVAAWWLQQLQRQAVPVARPVAPVAVAPVAVAPAAALPVPALVPASAAETPAPVAALAASAAAVPLPAAAQVAAAPAVAASPAAKAAARPASGSPLAVAAAAPVAAIAPAAAPAATAVPAPAPAPAPAALPANPPRPAEKAETPLPNSRAVSLAARAAGGKTYSPRQVSANLLAEAVALDQQGRQEEAKQPLQRALAANPQDVQARQMLVQLQLDTGQAEQARALLADGQRLQPELPAFTLQLARLSVEAGDVGGAIQQLQGGLAAARGDPGYHAFLAALQLRVNRYDDAVQHYLLALRADPGNASWLVGVGAALEGQGKPADAAEAYRRAAGAGQLTPEMTTFLTERLARLGR